MRYPSIRNRNLAAAAIVADAWSVLEDSCTIAGANKSKELLRHALAILEQPVGLELRQAQIRKRVPNED